MLLKYLMYIILLYVDIQIAEAAKQYIHLLINLNRYLHVKKWLELGFNIKNKVQNEFNFKNNRHRNWYTDKLIYYIKWKTF